MNNIEYEVPTLNQTYDMLINQAQKIHATHFKPDLIIPIARGGLIPGRIHSDLLQTSNIAVIQIEFYIEIAKTLQEPSLKQPLAVSVQNRKILLVDDIADTGKTLQLAKKYLSNQGAGEVVTATLYTKPQSITTPDFYEKQTNRWIVFPWDAKETIQKIAADAEGKREVNREIAKIIKAGLPIQLAERFLEEVEGELK